MCIRDSVLCGALRILCRCHLAYRPPQCPPRGAGREKKREERDEQRSHYESCVLPRFDQPGPPRRRDHCAIGSELVSDARGPPGLGDKSFPFTIGHLRKIVNMQLAVFAETPRGIARHVLPLLGAGSFDLQRGWLILHGAITGLNSNERMKRRRIERQSSGRDVSPRHPFVQLPLRLECGCLGETSLPQLWRSIRLRFIRSLLFNPVIAP